MISSELSRKEVADKIYCVTYIFHYTYTLTLYDNRQ